jgi:hypothetical protein
MMLKNANKSAGKWRRSTTQQDIGVKDNANIALFFRLFDLFLII